MALALSLSSLVYVGCSRHADRPHSLDKTHVRSMTVLLGMASSKLGHLPNNEGELKKAIATLKLNPEKMGVTSFDDLFVSERDGKPLVLVYGAPPKDSDIVVYEQNGINDKILVGHRIGIVEEVDKSQFKNLALHKP